MTLDPGSASFDRAPNLPRRVKNYLQYRPHYPRAILELIKSECSLLPDHVIADIGSGTGILAKVFVENGNPVYGVEPDPYMRAGAEFLLQGYANYTGVQGKAEATNLADESVGFVTAGQAFHWFDAGKSKVEFLRILRSAGWVVLTWNMQRTQGKPFLEALQRFWVTPEFWRDPPGVSPDLRARVQAFRLSWDQVRREVLDPFFGRGNYREAQFENHVAYDSAGLRGRILSNGPALEPGGPHFEAMLLALDQLFDAHQNRGTVTIEHDCRVVFGRL